MEPDPAAENRLSAVQDKALSIDLILETILHFVTHDDENKVAITDVCSVRLVNKSWLLATTNVLLASQKAIFRIGATRRNSTAGSQFVKKHGKILDILLGSVTLAAKACVPLYAISASPGFFNGYNSRQLRNCLSKCGNDLIELDLQIGENRVMKPLNSSITSLSNLRVFSVSILPDDQHINSSLGLIQSVFDVCEQLVSFELCWFPRRIAPPLKSLADLVFPKLITDMFLHCPLNTTNLQVLVKNVLPNLRTLRLRGSLRQTNGTQISKVLENYRKSLESFCLFGLEILSTVDVEPPLILEIPLMEKLKVLKLDTRGVLLATDNSAVERLLPALHDLTLFSQSPSMLRRWTDYSRFDLVTCLTICFKDSEEQLASGIANANLFPKAFPNLLNLRVTVQELEVLMQVTAIWRELKGLRELTIRYLKITSAVDQNFWDALFTGYSADRLRTARDSPDPWNELEEQEPDTDSIRNLINLEKLELECLKLNFQISLITDATFRLGFLKMPKLSRLILVGGFSASDEMTETWRGESRRSIEQHMHPKWYQELVERFSS